MIHRHIIFGVAFFSATSALARATDAPKPNEIVVKWEDHGEEKRCYTLAVRIEQKGHTFKAESTAHGFALNSILEGKAKNPKARFLPMKVRVSCDGFTLEFPEVPAWWFHEGLWVFGIDYPPFRKFDGHAVPERGTWVSYFDNENTEPGLEMSIAHDEPFHGLYKKAAEQHPGDTNDEKYADAYAKAVLGVEYHKNRDLLLTNFLRCSTITITDQDDCQSALGEYLINLYWRGDDSLLQPMMAAAADKVDVLSEMGWLYGALLTRRPQVAVAALENLPVTKQEMICRQAGEDEFWSVPDYERANIGKAVNALGQTGQVCWAIAEAARKHPYGN